MPTFEAGQAFDRYRIVRWLGSGVSGESYEAEDTMLRRKVALKLICPQETLPDSARRQFFREMQGISGLNHPFIAPVLDYGEINDRLYVARRFTSPGSLLSAEGRLWFRSPLEVGQAIRYSYQLAQALQAIHARGYVHGAVTFGNLLVLHSPSTDNQSDYAPFLLADAGLAHFARRFGFGQNQQPPLPVSAAPEQIGRRAIPASDQFALAALLYAWLAGRPPYVGTPDEVERLKLTETITPLSTINPHVSLEQDGMVLRALSVFPEDRYPTVLSFANALLSTLSESTDALATPASSAIAIEPEPAEEPPASLSAPVEPAQAEPDTPPQPASVQSEAPVAGAAIQPETEPAAEQPAIVVEHTPDATQPVAAEAQEAFTPPMPEMPDTPALTAFGEAQGTPPTACARVIISSPYSSEPLEVALEQEEVTVGRAGSSDILLDFDHLTSRHHALFQREGQRYLLFDLRSANGVLVNGQKLNPEEGYPLTDGDHISIGNYELIFRAPVYDSTQTSHAVVAVEEAS
jgi:serine/threonine protein kinase